MLQLKETKTHKMGTNNRDFNFSFDKTNGQFLRWGASYNDDPEFSKYGPELIDIEITTSCSGVGGKLCPFCYKSNTPNGKNMSLETFKKIIDKLPKYDGIHLTTQIAFGLDSHATSNPETFEIFQYCKDCGIVPNVTVAEISDETADKLVAVCGAVAISRYADKNICYDSIKKLTDRGLIQCNMHFCLHENSFEQALETLEDRLSDKRLEKLNAIVFLSLKTKGRGVRFTPLSNDKFKILVEKAFEKGISIGFDSCSAHKFLNSIKEHEYYSKLEQLVEKCESFGLFSAYINVEGKYFPCSFLEKSHPDWAEGLDIVNCNDFLKDIWFNPLTSKWREISLKCNRECPIFKI